ncbi:hypothetical protein COCCADRAFT_27107 [Bipolaris zeicola 26-R-13]|uniref:Uncharacterized protein n=1 Tax=Cochliobolus carbonum (strain 26-R-13) TaxID=930089 RepID=W6XY37_COCC2|nr:uncharacterized protein COCCADRAFT_27107 [Bipolaris zeicola 26-R-13]EUC32377.1 hypothetical protein COCCADRAFT_27107 [Bipolaris zeicola 26-R-13]
MLESLGFYQAGPCKKKPTGSTQLASAEPAHMHAMLRDNQAHTHTHTHTRPRPPQPTATLGGAIAAAPLDPNPAFMTLARPGTSHTARLHEPMHWVGEPPPTAGDAIPKPVG